MKPPFNVGDRIELLVMENDPDPILPGTQGLVTFLTDLSAVGIREWQVGVDWDNGRRLMLSWPKDRVRKVG